MASALSSAVIKRRRLLTACIVATRLVGALRVAAPPLARRRPSVSSPPYSYCASSASHKVATAPYSAFRTFSKNKKTTPLTILPASLSAAEEFGARLAVVEALRGVTVDDGDVVSRACRSFDLTKSRGLVVGVDARADVITVELELPAGFDRAAAEALARRCEVAAEATRDALAAESDAGVTQATRVDVLASVGAVPASEPSAPPQDTVERAEGEAAAAATVSSSSSSPSVIPRANDNDPSLAGVRKIVAISSCKGGVGKSTVAVNAAYALAAKGLRVGVCDADVYGPSLPTLVGAVDDPTVRLAREDESLLAPFTKGGVKLMSFGFLNAEAPAMMRGSRVSGVVEQLARRVAWGDLDVLILDLPPGTGDIQLTVCQSLNIDAAVVVTTPSRLAFDDVVKGVKLFDAVDVPVVAVVENMASVRTPMSDAREMARQFCEERRLGLGLGLGADDDDLSEALAELIAAPRRVFGDGHARQMREMWGIETFFELDLWADLARRGDAGAPLFLVADDTDLSDDERRAKQAFGALADGILDELDNLAATRPPDVSFDGVDVVVTSLDDADDDKKHRVIAKLNPLDLRAKCRCAECVSTPEPALRAALERAFPPETVAYAPVSITRSGNYAIEVVWSDGHFSLLPYKSFLPVGWDLLQKDAPPAGSSEHASDHPLSQDGERPTVSASS